jgi:hypothetical protein
MGLDISAEDLLLLWLAPFAVEGDLKALLDKALA